MPPLPEPPGALLRLAYDRRLAGARTHGVVGVDEAGRGCLAGPVAAAAVYLPPGFLRKRSAPPQLEAADDSKKLSPATREAIAAFLRDNDLPFANRPRFAVALGSIEEIESCDILGATCLAMRRAIESLDLPGVIPVIDGVPLPRLGIEHRALIRGDSLSLAIALASILAKTTRDQLMRDLDQTHPGYGFAVHKGYGTLTHRQAILEIGPSPIHRLSFLRKIIEPQSVASDS